MHPRLPLVILLLGALTGCSQQRAQSADVVLFLPGVIGDGSWYSSLRAGLKDAGMQRQVLTISWGAPKAMFALNFSNAGIHDKAEQKLANLIVEHRAKHPQGRIDLLGHSAGCGVILGAMRKLDETVEIESIILIAPSVSPGYDVSAALARAHRVDAFISDRDTTFLSWRTSTFGSYDNVKTKAAGHLGFDLTRYSPSEIAGLTQHFYREEWKTVGNDGGHFGAISRRFVAAHVAPLLQNEARTR